MGQRAWVMLPRDLVYAFASLHAPVAAKALFRQVDGCWFGGPPQQSSPTERLPDAACLIAGPVLFSGAGLFWFHGARETVQVRRGRPQSAAAPGSVRVGRAVADTLHASYRIVPEPARRLLRLMGTVAAGPVPLATAAAFTGGDATAAARLLDVLCAAHLVRECPDGRYVLDPLLRRYAYDRVTEETNPSGDACPPLPGP